MDHTLIFSQGEILSLAGQIPNMNPDPVPRYLVLRDLLHCPPHDPTLQAAEQELTRSKWIAELAEAQFSDGTWGNFHTRVTKLKRRFLTSEHAIHRCLALGLGGRTAPYSKRLRPTSQTISTARCSGLTGQRNTIILGFGQS